MILAHDIFQPTKLEPRVAHYLDTHYPEHAGHPKRGQAVISADLDYLCLCPGRPEMTFGPKLTVPGAWMIAMYNAPAVMGMKPPLCSCHKE